MAATASTTSAPTRHPVSGAQIVLAIAACKLLLHVASTGLVGYGYFRDELYFLATGEHLAWGCVDMSPMVALVAWIGNHVLGGSLVAIRFLPALAGAAKIILTGAIARELGGGRAAQTLAAVAALTAPIYLAIDNLLSMNAFEPLFWMGCVYLFIRILKTGDGRLWIPLGALAGLGVMNKHSAVFFLASFAGGLLLTRERRHFTEKWIWIGGAVAVLLFLPNIIWQIQHGWPTYELLTNVKSTGKNVVPAPLEFLARQALSMNPMALPLWLAGLWFFLLAERGKIYRALGWTYVLFLPLMMVLQSKDYYLVPIYPMLLAGGAVLIAPWLAARRVLYALALALLVIPVAVLAPTILPVLPPGKLVAYQQRIGFTPPRSEVAHTAPIAQHLGDQFGWEDLVKQVAAAYHALPPEERAKTGILATNYGQAGAIDWWGAQYGLPKAISGHQNYFLWGPRGYTGESLIVLGMSRSDLEEGCAEVRELGRFANPYWMPFENRPFFHCRQTRKPLAEVWPELKEYR